MPARQGNYRYIINMINQSALPVKYILVLLIVIDSFFCLKAEPEFALWTGNRCSSCHLNMQGGGMRREFGSTFGRDVAAIVPEEIGLEKLYELLDKKTYSYNDIKFAFGFDTRFQLARSHKVAHPQTKFFPMQASLSGNVNFYDDMILEGQYNFGPKVFQGQNQWMASALIKADPELPVLRIGHFQPSVGLRECDMTSLDRRTAAPDGTENFIAPDYAEYGFEFIYEGLDWLTANAGAFDSKSLFEVQIFGNQFPIVTIEHNPSFTLRSVIYPNLLFEDLPGSYLGGSALINGDFLYLTAFAGVALAEDFHIYGKYTSTNKPYARKTDNFIAGVTYIPYKGIMIGLRGERGKTDLIFTAEDQYRLYVNQVILNAKILPLPYIEIIPEYRFLTTEEYRSSRWAMQIHLYY